MRCFASVSSTSRLNQSSNCRALRIKGRNECESKEYMKNTRPALMMRIHPVVGSSTTPTTHGDCFARVCQSAIGGTEYSGVAPFARTEQHLETRKLTNLYMEVVKKRTCDASFFSLCASSIIKYFHAILHNAVFSMFTTSYVVTTTSQFLSLCGFPFKSMIKVLTVI